VLQDFYQSNQATAASVQVNNIHLHSRHAGQTGLRRAPDEWSVHGREHELLGLASRCHPETLRQMRWANAMLKELSPQVLMN
jgi:hypothetical protein